MKINITYAHGELSSLRSEPESGVGVFSKYEKDGGKFLAVSFNVTKNNDKKLVTPVTPDGKAYDGLARSVLVSPEEVESPIEKALLEGADPGEVAKFCGVEIESIHYDRAGTDFETNQPIYRTRGLNFAPPHRPNMCYSQLTRKLQCAERDHETAILMYPEILEDSELGQEIHIEEILDKTRNTPKNLFFGGSVGEVIGTITGAHLEKTKIPEGGCQSEDGKAYRDPRTPAQIVKGIISEARQNGLQKATLIYTNVVPGEENRGPENFQYREDIIIFHHQEPTTVERGIDDEDSKTFEAKVVDTDNLEAQDFWSDVNADHISLELQCGDRTEYRNIVLQRTVIGHHKWTEVREL